MSGDAKGLAEHLFAEIAHGDDEHRAWLHNALATSPTITALTARVAELEAREAKLREAIHNPPPHRYWGAGELDCPREIKAGNGELHTLRCKVCGIDSPRSPICFAAVQGTINEA